MKPKVFISHSKKDQAFIKRIVDDLKPARIDVWYDDWEIPPGSSLRTKIFDEGISVCDLFFVYLTSNSIDSFWVQKELDAAFVLDVEKMGGFIALFVDSDTTRNRLSLDLRSRRIPEMNSGSYSICLLELAALSWDAYLKRKIVEVKERNRVYQMELEKKLAQQELELTKLRLMGVADHSKIKRNLEEKIIELDGERVPLIDVFRLLSDKLACGTTGGYVVQQTKKWLNLDPDIFHADRDLGSEILGPLIIMGLIKVQPPAGEWHEIFYLTDLGRTVLLGLETVKD